MAAKRLLSSIALIAANNF